MFNTNKQTPFWLFTIAALCALILPRLIAEGMFMDGLIYSVVSRNLAIGVGSMWKPISTVTQSPVFFADQPPLVFWIQSVFFRVFGDSLFVEGLYSFLTAVGTGALIVALWKQLTRGSEALTPLSWLPVFFWGTIGQVFWSYSNNMLENTLSLFVLGSVYLLLKGVMDGRRAWFWIVLAALVISAGLLAKGFMALVPAAVVGLYWVTVRGISFVKALVYTLALIASVALIMFAVLLNADARECITRYLDVQFLTSMRGERGATENPLGIFYKVLLELLPAIGIAVIVMVVAKIKGVWRDVIGTNRRYALLALTIGLVGTLPLTISPRQNAYYLVPFFPFYALGIAALIAPVVAAFVERINVRARSFRFVTILGVCACSFVLAASASRVGTTGRDKALLEDIKQIGDYVGRRTTVSVCRSMRDDWLLQFYFSRYFEITMDHTQDVYDYAVLRENCKSIDVGEYEVVDLSTSNFKLYRRKNKN